VFWVALVLISMLLFKKNAPLNSYDIQAGDVALAAAISVAGGLLSGWLGWRLASADEREKA
jgi:hypothetical protein